MLNNPILKDMGIEDLNQRYRETYIVYKEKPYFCNGFAKSIAKGVRVNIILSDLGTLIDGRSGAVTPFNWELLDTSRPAAGYYLTDGDAIVHLAYNTVRQYSRGLTPNNTSLRKLSGQGCNYSTWFNVLEQHIKGMPRVYQKKTTQKILEELKNTRGCLLSNLVAIYNKMIFINLQQVGMIDINTGIIYLDKPHYFEEIRDRVFDPIIEVGVQKPKEVKKTYDSTLFDVRLEEAMRQMAERQQRIRVEVQAEIEQENQRHQEVGPQNHG